MKEMKCKRCGANENRIHGFCSMECETAWEYEDEIRDLTARIAELEGFINQLIEAGELLAECSDYEGGKIAWDALLDKRRITWTFTKRLKNIQI